MQPLSLALPVLFTLFLWWFSTAAIMAFYGRARLLVGFGFAGMSIAAVLALFGVVVTRTGSDPLDVYFAVMCAVVIWSWQLAGYYFGVVTGPANAASVEALGIRARLTDRFRAALNTSLYHELLALVFAVLLALLTWAHPNRWALWMYVALWLMHVSAKLNVFLGVRNFRIDLLPRELRYLRHLIGRQHTNALLPVSIILASSATLVLVYRAIIPTTSAGDMAGLLMVATMLGLGVLEHGLLVVPLPAALWSLGLRPPDAEADAYGRLQTEFVYPVIERADRAKVDDDD